MDVPRITATATALTTIDAGLARAEGQVHNYSGAKKQPLFTGLSPVANAQQWARDRENFLNAIKQKESRIDIHLARRFITLRCELLDTRTRSQSPVPFAGFIEDNSPEKVATRTLPSFQHTNDGNNRNVHAHFWFAVRRFERDVSWQNIETWQSPKLGRWGLREMRQLDHLVHKDQYSPES